jgi:hypothetical protein
MFDLKQLEPNANNSAYYLIVFALLMLFASIWVGLNDPSNAIALYICLTGCLLGFSLVLWQLYQQKKSRVATQAGASSAARRLSTDLSRDLMLLALILPAESVLD